MDGERFIKRGKRTVMASSIRTYSHISLSLSLSRRQKAKAVVLRGRGSYALLHKSTVKGLNFGRWYIHAYPTKSRLVGLIAVEYHSHLPITSLFHVDLWVPIEVMSSLGLSTTIPRTFMNFLNVGRWAMGPLLLQLANVHIYVNSRVIHF